MGWGMIKETARSCLLLGRRTVCGALTIALLVAVAAMPRAAFSQIRIKDVTDVEGVRNNQLVGYGIIVGLNGTGDKLNNSVFTRESLIGMLEAALASTLAIRPRASIPRMSLR